MPFYLNLGPVKKDCRAFSVAADLWCDFDTSFVSFVKGIIARPSMLRNFGVKSDYAWSSASLQLKRNGGSQIAVQSDQNRSSAHSSLPVQCSLYKEKLRADAPLQVTELPSTFRRLVAHRTGKSFRDVANLEEVEMKPPGDGEVLIRVIYAGINGGCETFRARGEFLFAPNAQKDMFTLGAEGAGVVVARGPIGVPDHLCIGTHVTFVGGAFSEYVVANSSICWPVSVATPESVAATISGTVANAALKKVAQIKSGDTVFVSAGAGATGSFAVQLAALAGCYVVTSCRNAKKAEVLQRLLDKSHHHLHAEASSYRVIDYSREGVVDVLKEEYGGKIDVAYEGVGGPLQRAAWENMAPGGRLLVVGYISGYPHAIEESHAPSESPSMPCNSQQSRGDGTTEEGNVVEKAMASNSNGDMSPSLPPSHDLFWKGLRVEGAENRVALGNVWPADRRDIVDAKREVFDLIDRGLIHALVDERSRDFTGLESIPDAIEYMLSGEAIGKVVCGISKI